MSIRAQVVWNQKLHTTAGFIIETVLGDYLITGYFSHMIDIAGDTAVVDYLIMLFSSYWLIQLLLTI